MSQITLEQSRPGGRIPPLLAFTGKRVTVHAQEGSYPEKRAPAELQEAERSAEALEKLLRPQGGDPTRVQIYLVDPMVDLRSGAEERGPAGNRHLVRVIAPEAPVTPVLQALVPLLMAEWFSPAVAQVPLFTLGIAGVLSASLDAGPSIKEADEAVRARLEAGETPSIFPLLVPTAPTAPIAPTPLALPGALPITGPDETDKNLVATSFVGYLLKIADEGALRQLLSAYDPERRDQAANAAYQRPLGTLEESWHAEVRRHVIRGTALPFFVRRLLPLARPYRLQIAELLVYSALAAGYGLVAPLAVRYLLDTVIPQGAKTGNATQLIIFILALLAIDLLNSGMTLRQIYLDTWLNRHVQMDLQERIFAHLQQLAHNFYSEARVGDVMVRLSDDVSMVQSAMSLILTSWLNVVLSTIIAVGVLLAISPLLAVLAILAVPLFLATYLPPRSRWQQVGLEQQTATGAATAFVQENLSAYPVVRAYGMEKRAEAGYHSRLVALLKAALRLGLLNSLLTSGTNLAMTLGQLVVYGVGGYLVIVGRITIGDLVAFSMILPTVFMPVAVLSGYGRLIESASGSLQRVNELLAEPVTISDKPGAQALPPLSGEIRLDHVTFSYTSDRAVLNDLSLAIPAGAHVAIVGPSGSGKSTIANLLLHFWDPQDGQVLFDGHDLREVTVASVREQIAIVFQDTFIFDTSVRENIALSRPDATDAEIAEAARGARLDNFIEALPAGYDTVLGERGVQMSGGQRQRLSIARALLRNPRLLVLDEATSALDAQTESDILEALAGFMKGRTTVSITHRLTVAAGADHILVVDGGRLVQEGTHAELLAAGGLYSRLYNEQVGYQAGPSRRVEIKAAHLRSIPLFASLPSEALAGLAAQLLPERYAAGEDVVKQGEPGDKLYIISKGQVEVLLDVGRRLPESPNRPPTARPTKKRINVLNKGDYFGEMALLEGGLRTTTVRTIEPSDLFSLSREDFQALLASELAMRGAVNDTMAARRAALASTSAQSLPATPDR